MNPIYPYDCFRIGPSSIKRDTLTASLSGMGSLSGREFRIPTAPVGRAARFRRAAPRTASLGLVS